MNCCIYCQSDQYEVQFSFRDIFEETQTLVQCKECDVYYLNPLPSSQQFKRAYDETYYGLGDKKFNIFIETLVDWFRKQNAKKFSDKLPLKAVVLDVGCGNGSFLANLSKLGNYTLHGVEPAGKSADRASKHKSILLHKGVLKKDTYQVNQFDAITFTHVFEHLPNPSEVIQIVNQISTSNALLQIEIPNIESWQAKLFKGNWFHLDPPRHLNMFSPKALKRELKRSGWQLASESYFSPQFSPFGVQQSLLNVLLSRRDVLYEHLKGNKEYTLKTSKMSLFLQKLFQWVTYPIFVFTDLVASMFKRGGTVKLVFKKEQ